MLHACFTIQLKCQKWELWQHVLHSMFACFHQTFSKCQVLCSVLKLFDFDFPSSVGAEDQHQAEPAWFQPLGQGHWELQSMELG